MAQIVIVGAYIFMILTQIFAFYWHSNEVREESMAIAQASYSGPWLNVDDTIKKKLLMMTIRAQRPLEVITTRKSINASQATLVYLFLSNRSQLVTCIR